MQSITLRHQNMDTKEKDYEKLDARKEAEAAIESYRLI